MKPFLCAALLAAAAAFGSTVSAQLNFADIPYTAVDALNGFPANIHLGEAAGVATNSKGDIFVFTRTGSPIATLGTARTFAHGGSRLLQFDRNGKFVREIGQGVYGFLQAQQVRVDPQDNVWVVDQYAMQVIKFDPTGRIQMVLGRKPEAIRVPALPLEVAPDTFALVPPPPPEPPAAAPAGGRGGANDGRGAEGEQYNRPTDVAWDAMGNIYVADGYGNARVAKYDRNGKWVKNWGRRGTGDGQFNVVKAIVIDAASNVYVADRDNKRIQVFDAAGTFKTQFRNVGSPWAMCITPPPRQFIYVSNSNPPDNLDYDGEILKLTLDGRIVGKFGKAGKLAGEFGTTNSIDCRNENELYVGELGNWRVQKVTLRPAATATK